MRQFKLLLRSQSRSVVGVGHCVDVVLFKRNLWFFLRFIKSIVADLVSRLVLVGTSFFGSVSARDVCSLLFLFLEYAWVFFIYDAGMAIFVVLLVVLVCATMRRILFQHILGNAGVRLMVGRLSCSFPHTCLRTEMRTTSFGICFNNSFLHFILSDFCCRSAIFIL